MPKITEVKPPSIIYPLYLKDEDQDIVLGLLWNSLPLHEQAKIAEYFFNQKI